MQTDSGTFAFRYGGQLFHLLPGRGLYWPAEEMLCVADAHLGKEASFRHSGIPVPAGCTEGTLEIIARLVCQTGARRLCVLGDLFHDATSLSADVRTSVERFLEGHQDIDILLVRGNHDQRVGRLPKQWPIREVDEGEREGNVWLGHHPIEAVPDSVLYLCGHVHPAIRIGTRQESLGVFPCFWLSQGCLVLPAIGEFTGTHRIHPSAEDQVWAVVEDRVIPHHRPPGKSGSGQRR